MKNVIHNTILIEKILKYCNMNIIGSLSVAMKDYNREMFCMLDNVWQSKCVLNFNAHTLSWFDLYCALSSENILRNRHLALRKRYIEVANCCKCRLYCRQCSEPMTQSDDLDLKCPHCNETSNINEFDISHNSLDNPMIDRGSLPFFCVDCRRRNQYISSSSNMMKN